MAPASTLAFILVVLAAGCSETPQARPEPPPCPDRKFGCVVVGPGEPIEVGTLLSMSRPTADIGEDARNGARVAADLLSPPGEILGHAIEWVDKDDHCSFEGRDGARDLASNPDTVAVIGTTCTVSALGTSDTILSEQGIVLISPSNSNPMLTDPKTHQPFYLRVGPNDRILAVALATFAFRQARWRSASTIHDSIDAYGLQEAFAEAFTALGGRIARQEPIQTDDRDFRPLLTELAADDIDGLYLPVTAVEGDLIARQARTIPGLTDTTLLASDALLTAEFVKATAAGTKEMYVAGTDHSLRQRQLQEDRFLPAYEQRFGVEPGSAHAVYGFDAAMLLFEAIGEVAVPTTGGGLLIPRTGLRDALYATKDVAGAGGSLTCDENGDCRQRATISLTWIQDGSIHPALLKTVRLENL